MGMQKRLVSGVLMAAAAAVAIQTPQLLKGNSEYNTALDSAKVKSVVAENIQKNDESYSTSQVPLILVETIDGDTIKAKINGKVETIRYLLVDTPESKKPGMCVQPFAKEATRRNDELVRSGKLTMEMERGDTRDVYGRLLVYVFVDGESVQGTLLKGGYARLAYIMNPPYKYLSTFVAAENVAKKDRVKIWSEENYVSHYGFNGCVKSIN